MLLAQLEEDHPPVQLTLPVPIAVPRWDAAVQAACKGPPNVQFQKATDVIAVMAHSTLLRHRGPTYTALFPNRECGQNPITFNVIPPDTST